MRFSYAGSHADMITALDRIETWLGSRSVLRGVKKSI